MKKLKTITVLASISLLFSSQLFAGQVSLMKPPIDGGVDTNGATTETTDSWLETLMDELFSS